MNQSLQLDLVAALGYAVFERNSEGTFRAWGETPGWLRSLVPAEHQSGYLADAFPFLEVFLPDAE